MSAISVLEEQLEMLRNQLEKTKEDLDWAQKRNYRITNIIEYLEKEITDINLTLLKLNKIDSVVSSREV